MSQKDKNDKMNMKKMITYEGEISVPFQRAFKTYRDAKERIKKKYEDRGESGKEQMEKELEVIEKEKRKDFALEKEYGKDAYKAKSFGTRKFSQGGLVYGKKFSGIY